MENYIETNKHFSGASKQFDMSKKTEFIYFVNGKVIKFFEDPEIARRRYERSKFLQGLCPLVEDYRNNFYAYSKADGQNLYEVFNSHIFKNFLQWSKNSLWANKLLSEKEAQEFYKVCKEFYYDKTIKRVEQFFSKNNAEDVENNINGVVVPPLKTLLNKIDWEDLCKGVPVRFHGDFKFGNILVATDPETQLQKFILVDWRQDFGGLLEFGDLYYDLGKLYAGIVLSEKIIRENKFTFDISGSSVYYKYFLNSGLLEAKEDYESFIKENNFDLNKIKIIAALSFINIAALHHYPFDHLAYYLGKNMLHRALIKEEKGNDKF